MTKGKPVWASKTFWANTMIAIAAIAADYGLNLSAELQGALVIVIVAVVNIVLRFATKEPVTLSRHGGGGGP